MTCNRENFLKMSLSFDQVFVGVLSLMQHLILVRELLSLAHWLLIRGDQRRSKSQQVISLMCVSPKNRILYTRKYYILYSYIFINNYTYGFNWKCAQNIAYFICLLRFNFKMLRFIFISHKNVHELSCQITNL